MDDPRAAALRREADERARAVRKALDADRALVLLTEGYAEAAAVLGDPLAAAWTCAELLAEGLLVGSMDKFTRRRSMTTATARATHTHRHRHSPEEAGATVRRAHAAREAARAAEAALGEGADERARLELLQAEARRTAWIAAEANTGLVCQYVARYVKSLIDKTSHSAADLVQEGVIGLLRALETYTPLSASGVPQKFSTYAWWWIRQSIQRSLVSTGLMVRLPAHVSDARRQLDKSDRTGAPHAVSSGVAQSARLMWTGYDALPRDEDTCHSGMSLGATYPAFVVPDDGATDRRRALSHVAALPERERRVIVMRWGLDGEGERTLDEVAALLPKIPAGRGKTRVVSRERVRQLEVRAMGRLQAWMGEPKTRLNRRAR